MAYYLGLIHSDADTGFGVSFPDFPGCITVGDTLDEAHRLAGEALAMHISGMKEDGEAIPSPSSMDAVLASDLAQDHKAVIVVLAHVPTKLRRVNVVFESSLLSRIDAACPNRSAFLARAAQNELERNRKN